MSLKLIRSKTGTKVECRDRSLSPIHQEEDGGGAKDYTAKLPLDRKMYFQYYVQDDADSGTLMDTKVPISEVANLYTQGCNSSLQGGA